MRFAPLLPIVALATIVLAQNTPKQPPPEPKSVTVPITLDHNRVVIDVGLALPDGRTQQVHAWVDNGNPDLYLSRHVATLMGLAVVCNDSACSAPPPAAITIGGMKLSLAAVKEVKIPLKPANAAAAMAPGMNAEINLPSTILRNYDVLINFPDRQFTIGLPGSVKFNGVKSKMLVNSDSGLIQIPSKVENKNYSLSLDLGSSISFLSGDLFDKLSAIHPDWPRMTGAVGPANMWGLPDEPNWKLMRIDRVQYGPLFLANLPFASFSAEAMAVFGKRGALPMAGLLGSEALLNYRIGLDYAHSAVYFDIGRTFNFPDFDVIGLILRPEDDGRFTILGVADFEAKPSVPEVQAGDHLIAVDGIPLAGSTMGQVWLMLGGSPGQERTLTLERGGRQFTVVARVRHFLGETEDNSALKGKSRKN